MSDRESEVNAQYPEVESAVTGSFSSNGNDPGAYALAAEIDGEERSDGGNFLTDLARAMQTTAAAEQARDAEITEQKRKSHLDAIRAREAIEAEDLREIAKDDVKGIDAWSDGEIKRIKLERERRIASRREQLQIRLEEHRGVVAREVDAVEASIATYRTEIERFFFRLGSETDPVEIARQAGTRPTFPALDQIGPEEVPAATAYPAATHDEASQEAVPYETAAHDEASQEVASSEANQDEAQPQAGTDVAQQPVAVEAEPIATEPEPEPIVAQAAAEPEPEPVVAEAEPVHEAVVAEAGAETNDEHDGSGPTPLIGVMDPEASNQPAEAQWQAEESTPPPADEQPVAERSFVAEGSVAETPSSDGFEVGPDVLIGEATDDGSGEPVTVPAAETVVMPRSTGAGSWLRWPNGASDRGDQDQ